MLTITILDHVTRAMFSKCTPLTTKMTRRNCGFVATKMENTSGSLLVVCILFLKAKIENREKISRHLTNYTLSNLSNFLIHYQTPLG